MSVIFIFRRDFRLIDNVGFIAAVKYSKKHNLKLLPIFIYNKSQTGKKNDYRSKNAIVFMMESLNNLNDRIKKYGGNLYTFVGDGSINNDIKILELINKKIKTKSIFFNSDFTPFSKSRDNHIEKYCKKKEIICCYFYDYLLSSSPNNLLKKDRNVYTTFTPFKNNAYNYFKKNKIVISDYKDFKNVFVKTKIKTETIDIPDCKIDLKGSRHDALKYLVKKNDYGAKRNDLNYSTTRLSAYIKFGLVSIREVFLFYKGNLALTDQLLWREFYYLIFHFHPELLSKKIMLKQKLKRIKNISWTKNNKIINAFINGKTGNKLVDACLNQLFTTGYMHNRGRLVVSSYCRLLNIDWKVGEKLFAQHLTDYDPIVNSGNWLFQYGDLFNRRIISQQLLNPAIQQKRFDKKNLFIKKYLPKNYNIKEEIVKNYTEQKEKSNNLYKNSIK